MLSAFGLGAAAQASLLLAGLAVFWVKAPRSIVGALAGFGAGALIAAVALDLLPGAEVMSGAEVALWTLVGAGAFVVGDRIVEAKFGGDGSGSALGIVVGSVLDGVPESLIFGIQIATGATLSPAFLAAVFVSNIPQALAPSASLAESGWNKRRVTMLWMSVVLACGVASALGFGLATAISGVNGARVSAFACGGILAMLSDSLVPFAHERSELAGLWTVIGFCASLAMT